MNKKNLLFVCKYNRFRSKVAEAYFNKINKKINVLSAGIFRGNPISNNLKRIVKKYGLTMRGSPKSISSKLLSKTDIIVIVADDVPKSLFMFNDKYLQKVIVWKINDSPSSDEKAVKKIIEKIINSVNSLNKKLNEGSL